MAISKPSDLQIGPVKLTWSGTVTSHVNGYVTQKQRLVDSEVLRRCSPLVPFRTGTLERSGTVGTVIGSGLVKYSTPYARHQYYSTPETRKYDPRRGAKWFERMKVANKKEIEAMINKP